jgi:serine/threonine-protein kinase ATR
MRDFIGLNGHTVQFKPELYSAVCAQVRDYHPFDWDVGEDTSRSLNFPMAANGVDWGKLYGSWVRAGFNIDVCIMFDRFPAAAWKDRSRDATSYGKAFAGFFGPSGAHPLVSSVEIGNEPSKYTQAQYREVFQNMARGLREGDAKLKIATCAVMTGKTDEWSKPLSAVAGLEELYDVLNIHSYPFAEAWPTWRRSHPEDPSIRYLKAIEDLVRWRDEHAPGKQVWLTEFGYDSATKPPAANGPWKQWVGVSDEQQAQYILRSFLLLSAMPIDRAYLYFFDDHDEPQLHGASGITRNFQPKPSFYAMAQLFRALGDFRFARAAERKEGELYCFEYESADNSGARVYVAWSPTGSRKSWRRMLRISAEHVDSVEPMATTANAPAQVTWKASGDGIELEVGESPVYIRTH